jgi:hypothetical protein
VNNVSFSWKRWRVGCIFVVAEGERREEGDVAGVAAGVASGVVVLRSMYWVGNGKMS